jgi:hypothetical protein
MDEHDLIAARHEADHAAMCWHFGWPIQAVTRGRGLEGETRYLIPIGGDPVQLAREYGSILLAPSLHSTVGADADLAKLTEILTISDHLHMSEIFHVTERITATSEYRRCRMALERALHTRLSVSASEVEELLA